jgi:hypothetical protein
LAVVVPDPKPDSSRRIARREIEPEAPSRPTPSAALPVVAAEAVPSVDVASIDRAEVARVERERREAGARLERRAKELVAEIEDQLRVPAYLSFREARIQAPDLAADELDRRRGAALAAAERVLGVLVRLQSEPELRQVVQASLGTQGRARLETGILRSFKSVPDAEQRARVLRMWSELEAAASEKR